VYLLEQSLSSAQPVVKNKKSLFQKATDKILQTGSKTDPSQVELQALITLLYCFNADPRLFLEVLFFHKIPNSIRAMTTKCIKTLMPSFHFY
jgi:hypothetical protein